MGFRTSVECVSCRWAMALRSFLRLVSTAFLLQPLPGLYHLSMPSSSLFLPPTLLPVLQPILLFPVSQ